VKRLAREDIPRRRPAKRGVCDAFRAAHPSACSAVPKRARKIRSRDIDGVIVLSSTAAVPLRVADLITTSDGGPFILRVERQYSLMIVDHWR
jgi:hypothetical protein